MKTSEFLFRFLEQKNIEQVFAVTGSVALWVFKALEENKNISAVFHDHEQAAVMAAEGWGRMVGKPGVAITTNGPGVMNALTGIAQAWTDSAPLIYICGDSKLEVLNVERTTAMRQYGAQDVPARALLEPITKKYFLLEKASNLPMILDEAYRIALEGRPGPVCINIPIDMQNADIDVEARVIPRYYEATCRPDDAAVRDVLSWLRLAKRPLILGGQGVRLSGGVEIFQHMVHTLDIPVVTSRMGNDIILSDDPLFVGRPGNYGNRASHFALQTCDVLLVLGSRLALNTTGFDPEKFAPQAKKILVEIDPAEIGKPGIDFDIVVRADAKAFIEAVIAKVESTPKSGRKDWIRLCSDWRRRYPVVLPEYSSAYPMSTYTAIEELSACASEYDVVLSDTGTCCNVVGQVWDVKDGQRLLISGGLSCMGFWATSIGVATAVGAEHNTICIVGDGSFQMNIQELATIAHYQVPVKLFVVNNNGYQIIRIGQKNYGMTRNIAISPETGVGLANTEKISEAYGIPYARITRAEDAHATISGVLKQQGPVICELVVEEDQVTLPKLKSKANPDGTFCSPNYEDLYPFIPQGELDCEIARAKGCENV